MLHACTVQLWPCSGKKWPGLCSSWRASYLNQRGRSGPVKNLQAAKHIRKLDTEDTQLSEHLGFLDKVSTGLGHFGKKNVPKVGLCRESTRPDIQVVSFAARPRPGWHRACRSDEELWRRSPHRPAKRPDLYLSAGWGEMWQSRIDYVLRTSLLNLLAGTRCAQQFCTGSPDSQTFEGLQLRAPIAVES